MGTLYIRNMVCDRCISAVTRILQQEAIPFSEVLLGEVRQAQLPDKQAREMLAAALHQQGFELIDTRSQTLIERVKKACLRFLKDIEETGGKKENLSVFLSRQLHYGYSYLSDLFSSIEGITIEQYFIRLRIEKAKEWLVYDEWTLSEIAFRLGYSSVHHLSAQFKKVTGLTPTHFRKIGNEKRKTLDRL